MADRCLLVLWFVDCYSLEANALKYLQVTVTLDLKEGTLKFAHGGRSIGTIAGIKAPLHAAVTLTSSKQTVSQASMNTNVRPVFVACHKQWSMVLLYSSALSLDTRLR